MQTRQLTSIKALGKIEEYRSDIGRLQDALGQVPLWRPAAGLQKQCSEALQMMAALRERFERKLVVTILGPCGSGKSTLLNALAGQDDLSAVGTLRPTTQNVVALCQESEDARDLSEQLGSQNVLVRSSATAAQLEHILLIDTPDTDSTQQARHIPIVHKAISLSDVLICVFDAENPKRRDQADFLAPYIRLFHGDSLVAVLNKCDRLDERELIETIVPDFRAFLQTAWDKPVRTLLCISARSRLQQPGWNPKATPRHGLDQFDQLRQMIYDTFNRAGYGIDRRVENALSIRDFVLAEIASEVEKDKAGLADAARRIEALERAALKRAVLALTRENDGQLLGINVQLYQRLAQRWLGPVGWLIALWGRILVFGSGLGAMLRFGSPIRQILGVVSSLRHYKDAQVAVDTSRRADSLGTALRDYRSELLQSWPDIAETLVKSRLDRSVRAMDTILPESGKLGQELATLWAQALESEVERVARRLSGLFLQLLFNLPAVAILAHVGWLTAKNFIAGNYLVSGFFMHALVTVAIILLLCFFIFQGCVRLAAGRDRIHQRALLSVQGQLENDPALTRSPLGRQLEVLSVLAGAERVY
jgi:GTPase SAR1 family protein